MLSSESPVQRSPYSPRKRGRQSVTDAWNGFRGMLLRESDRPLTAFITPFERWRYIRAPQGFVSSGDGYNRRVDQVFTDFVRQERCVDDACH